MRTFIYLLMSFALLAISCSTADTVTYTIASEKAGCVGVGPQECLLVKKGNATKWEFFYSYIEGFTYEPGYEYVIKVREEKQEDAPADAPVIRYVMVKEVSKVAKESENLPPAIVQQPVTYQCTGKVLGIETETVGRGAAEGKMEVMVVKIQVTSSASSEIKEGEIVYCELIPEPRVLPVIDREYVFKTKYIHPAHAKGVYLLETDVMDLVK